MQLTWRVFILAACVFSSYTLSSLASEYVSGSENFDSLVRVLLAQTRSTYLGDNYLSPAENACVAYYNSKTEKLSYDLANQTNSCFARANSTIMITNEDFNASTNVVRANMKQAQRNIERCVNISDNALFLQCTIKTFDENLQLLDYSNSAAYQAQSEFVANQTQTVVQREGCISSVVGNAKTNMTEVANEYNTCLRNIKFQRQLN